MKGIEENGLNFYDLRLKWRKIFEDLYELKEKIFEEDEKKTRAVLNCGIE